MNRFMKKATVLILGIISFAVGIYLRFNAYNLIWPRNYSYSGPRENTIWAIKEAAVIDISKVLYLFGATIVILVIAKFIFQNDLNE